MYEQKIIIESIDIIRYFHLSQVVALHQRDDLASVKLIHRSNHIELSHIYHGYLNLAMPEIRPSIRIPE